MLGKCVGHLKYGKATKVADVARHLCSKTNYAHKWQLIGLVSEMKPVDRPKDSQKYDIYINEEGMYETVFSSLQPKAKDFRRHCCNVLFPHVRQQLTNKMKEDHQKAIEEKDATIALLTDTCKIVTIRFNPFSMKTWHYKHKRMCIRLSYKYVKTPLRILKHAMFLMRKIQAKTTLSSLYTNIQHLPMISFMTCHIMSQGYNDIKRMFS